jgi:hypothetical protein
MSRCHAIASPGLSGVKSFVGGAQKCFEVECFLLALLRRSQPEAEGDGKRARRSLDRVVGNTMAQPFRADDQIRRAATGKDDLEFSAAQTLNRGWIHLFQKTQSDNQLFRVWLSVRISICKLFVK